MKPPNLPFSCLQRTCHCSLPKKRVPSSDFHGYLVQLSLMHNLSNNTKIHERQNYLFAGQVLRNISSKKVINNYTFKFHKADSKFALTYKFLSKSYKIMCTCFQTAFTHPFTQSILHLNPLSLKHTLSSFGSIIHFSKYPTNF